MKRALVIGASGGIGAAVAAALRGGGTDVVALSRSVDGLDITDEVSVARVMGRLEGVFDLIFVATGALVVDGHGPEKAVDQMTAAGLAGQFAVNAIGPALILRYGLPLLRRDARAVFAALSARVGSIGDNSIGGWHSYRAAKAALNQIVHGAAIELKRTHRSAICVTLHPGTVETPFTAAYAGRHKTVPADVAAARLLDVIARLEVSQSGGFYDYSGSPVPW
jgi:NAD(P)-dependent dehydrogenase (short-subunit alcohol dehydrogenase family)